MGVKNHTGVIQYVETWTNAHGKFEIQTFGNSGFLWHFAEDDTEHLFEQDDLVEGRFYCPVYRIEKQGREVVESKHLFYILNPRDKDDDAVFLEIGPDGFLNTACQPAEVLVSDVKNHNLLPMWRVSSFGRKPEDTIPLLKKLTR